MPQTEYGEVTVDEIQHALDCALEHIELFEMRYTDDTRARVRLIITMRALSSSGPAAIERIGVAAQTSVAMFVTGCVAHVAMHVRDQPLLEAMRTICRAALARPSGAPVGVA